MEYTSALGILFVFASQQRQILGWGETVMLFRQTQQRSLQNTYLTKFYSELVLYLSINEYFT